MMKRYYDNLPGVQLSKCCIPSDFEKRETYSLDKTSAIWLYEHIKALLDLSSDIIDWKVPTVWSEYELEALSALEVRPEGKNVKHVFDLICSYIELAFDWEEKDEQLGTDFYWQYLRTAFQLWAIVFPRAWW